MKKTKRFISFLGAACLAFSLSGCQNGTTPLEVKADLQESGMAQTTALEVLKTARHWEPETKKLDAEPKDAEGSVLVAYFSATGNTRDVAEKIAAVTGADIYEIVPVRPYTAEDLDYRNSQSRTSLEMADSGARPEIGSEAIALNEYSTLYLGYPIWHGQAPRIMSTFVEHYDFDGITVIPFCTSGGSGIGSSGSQLAELSGSDTWLAGERFSANVSDSDLKAWIDNLQ